MPGRNATVQNKRAANKYFWFFYFFFCNLLVFKIVDHFRYATHLYCGIWNNSTGLVFLLGTEEKGKLALTFKII